jgi:hypothetical protein
MLANTTIPTTRTHTKVSQKEIFDYLNSHSNLNHTLQQGHIHLDVRKKNTPAVRSKLIEAGLKPHDFTLNEGSTNLHMPEEHLSFFSQQPDILEDFWSTIVSAAHNLGVHGYLEKEWAHEYTFEVDTDFNASIPFPFQLELTSLATNYGPKFREQELHFVYNENDSDPRLTDTLHNAGFYSVILDKDSGKRLRVMTAQGTKSQMNIIIPNLVDYLSAVGGFSDGEFILETVTGYEYLGGITAEQLPDVIAKINHVF